MANTFKNYVAADVGTSASTIITAAAATTVIGMTVANLTTSPITVSVYVTISAADYYVVKDAVVPAGGSLVPIGGDQKLVLETGDALKVISDTATSADVIASVLEIT
jgi:tryptophanyl-tRNA synthetase